MTNTTRSARFVHFCSRIGAVLAAIPAVTRNLAIQTTTTDHFLQHSTKQQHYDGEEYTTACNLVEVRLARSLTGQKVGVICILGFLKHMRSSPATNEGQECIQDAGVDIISISRQNSSCMWPCRCGSVDGKVCSLHNYQLHHGADSFGQEFDFTCNCLPLLTQHVPSTSYFLPDHSRISKRVSDLWRSVPE